MAVIRCDEPLLTPARCVVDHERTIRVIPDHTALDVVAALDAAQQAIPDLTVVFVPHCNGHIWQVDACCCRVYVAANDRLDLVGDRLVGAITALLIDVDRHDEVTELAHVRDELAVRRARRRTS